MTVYLTLLGRCALTLGTVAAAALLALILWKQKAQTPWTRDGRVRADVVQIAPDVSRPVANVAVKDNQWVNRGDVPYSTDPHWLKLAVGSTQAEVKARRQEMAMRQDAARRRARTQGVISNEDLKQTTSAASVAAANYQGAPAVLALAQLNLAHATVRTPVAGYITHLRLCPGDYTTAGVTKVAIIDGQRLWMVGYFEETRLHHIHVSDTAHTTLMGYDPVIIGHVKSIGHGIGDTNDETGALDLPEVEPIFSWVRLAQRVLVRIHIDTPPEGVERVVGLSVTISVIPARLVRRAGKSSPAGANQA